MYLCTQLNFTGIVHTGKICVGCNNMDHLCGRVELELNLERWVGFSSKRRTKGIREEGA